ncbi:PPOX class F420-dependent oxidoreductase [Streptomyces violaceusniger]|uniref:PPOX class F420-dependent oxidoreductase n=1 Tax=Streptomyces violaceusniger TaxID=68280 RepID=UPI003442B3A7
MSNPPLPEAAVAMLKKPNPAVIATIRSDGQPVSTATWYLWDDGRVLVNLDEGRKRLSHIRNDPRVTLTVLDEANWYNHISLIGRVVELQDDEDLSGIDRLSRQYLGKDYPQRDRGRVSAWIEIDRWHRWHGWGEHKENSQPG